MRSRTTGIAAAAATVVVAIGIAVALANTGGTDNAVTIIKSAPTETLATIPVTTATATTVAPTTTATPTTTTTEPATTTTVEPTTTTVEATTTAPPPPPPPTNPPPPPIAVATADDLVAALPTAAAMPTTWTVSADPPSTTFTPASGPNIAYCGGANADQRALDAGAVAVAYSPDIETTPVPGYLSINLYAFPTPEAASAFMAATTAQETSCLPEFNYQLPEGSGPGQFDGFSGSGYGAGAVWNLTDTLYYAPAKVAGADESFQMAAFYHYATRFGGKDYSATDTEVTQYERHGRIVMTATLSGHCCQVGFSDADATQDYQPTTPELLNWVDMLRPGIIQVLQDRGVLER